MKKYIKGKVYDTNTAKKLGYVKNMDDRENDYYQIEVLYQKKTGEFFIWGSSGGCGDYAEMNAGVTTQGTKVVPITDEHAEKWVLENLSGEEYDDIFGELEEVERQQKITIKIDPSVHKIYREMLFKKDRTMQKDLEEYINNKVKEEK